MNKSISQTMSHIFGASLLVVSQTVVTQPAYGQQCFHDAGAAYDYLMATELNDDKHSRKNAAAFQVNINTASESELTTLAGIGSKKAQDIILYRDGLGHFNSVDELAKVKGIGDKTIQNNRSRLTVK